MAGSHKGSVDTLIIPMITPQQILQLLLEIVILQAIPSTKQTQTLFSFLL